MSINSALYRMMFSSCSSLLLLLLLPLLTLSDQFDEDQYGVKFADECETCKIVAAEFEMLLKESEGKHEVLESGYSFMNEKKKTKYVKSELRLVETVEALCGKLLDYRIHKERKDWTRFSRGTSETFRALNNLVDKGVKVDIGIPQGLWDKPSAEITDLKTKCETLLEEHEETIENWYFKAQENALEEYLCRARALKSKDKSCLDIKGESGEIEQKKKKNKKAKKKNEEL